MFERKEPFGELTIDQVEDLIARGAASVYDNNSPERFQQGHLPNAKWADSEKPEAAGLPEDRSKTLVFYCGGPL
ncbi:MAG: rhodanese-like domain-containing protein [Deltaproteobacteria bacterium]